MKYPYIPFKFTYCLFFCGTTTIRTQKEGKKGLSCVCVSLFSGQLFINKRCK